MAIQVVKCKSCNMFYDANKFDKCPYCGAAGTTDEGKTVQINSERTGSKPILPTMSIFDVGANAATKEELKSSEVDTASKLEKTDSMYTEFPQQPIEQPVDETPIMEEPVMNEQPVFEAQPEVEKPVIVETKKDESELFSHLEQNISQQIKTNNDGKTVGFFSSKRTSAATASAPAATAATAAVQPTAETVKTVIVEEEAEPFAGWLVCVKGNNFARSYKINVGRNSIGRDDSNHIVVRDDPKISRSKHCWLTYEPKHRTFMLQPGDSSGLTYLNDEYVTENKTLKAFDKIEIGDTLLMFVPLCGEEFSWEDYLGE